MSEPPPFVPTAPAAGMPRRQRHVWILALLVLALAGASGCGREDGTGRVALAARRAHPRDPRMLEIHAQYAAPAESLQFRWFADLGECDPQESVAPTTLFRFAEGEVTDRITVDVWQDGKRVGQRWIDVRMDEQQVGPPPDLRIEVSDVPPAAKGGPDTRANIAGRVTGALDPAFRVLIYARDEGVWYLQPTAQARHPIGPDGSWSTWTHTGYSYAVLVVTDDHLPIRTLDLIPSVRGNILARLVIDGRKE